MAIFTFNAYCWASVRVSYLRS